MTRSLLKFAGNIRSGAAIIYIKKPKIYAWTLCHQNWGTITEFMLVFLHDNKFTQSIEKLSCDYKPMNWLFSAGRRDLDSGCQSCLDEGIMAWARAGTCRGSCDYVKLGYMWQIAKPQLKRSTFVGIQLQTHKLKSFTVCPSQWIEHFVVWERVVICWQVGIEDEGSERYQIERRYNHETIEDSNTNLEQSFVVT